MYIDVGHAVRVVDGYNKGALGIVEKIRLEDITGAVLVAVTLIPQPGNPARGLSLFDHRQLRRHLARPRELEDLQLEAVDIELEAA